MFKRKNIWFFCPACDKKLVVGIEAGGFRADCPECHKNIPIPARSSAYPTWVKKWSLIAIQVLLVGAGIGTALWVTLSRPEPEAVVEKVAPPSKPAVVESAPVADSSTNTVAVINDTLQNEHVELQGKYNKLMQWMMDNYRGKYPLPERLVKRLRITPLNDDNQVNPELVELLKMNDLEKSKVQDIFDYIQKSITEAELDNALITDKKPDQITLTVPTYPDAGGQLHDNLYTTLEDTLGGPRFDRLVDVAEQDMKEQFHYFGEASRTLTFEIIRPKKEGDPAPYLLIRDGWVMPDGDSVRLTKVTEKAVTTVPESYRAYQEFLPENMAQYAIP